MKNVRSAPRLLPEILPVFPLTGVVIFPGMVLPLQIFEPRYRNMVEDALSAEGAFGMIQPLVPQQDNRALPGAEKQTPELYSVGCAGYIERWEKLSDGRYVLELRGMSRFRSEGELPLHRGYRRVKASYRDFSDFPFDASWRGRRGLVIELLREYTRAHGLALQMEQVDRISDIELISILGMSLPLHPAEKQALLEASSPQEQERVLLNLLRLGSGSSDPEEPLRPRTVH